MHTFIMQDWTSVQSTAANSNVVQGESDWLDLAAFQDVFLWVDCRSVGAGSVYVYFETSPTRDDSLFVSVLTGTPYVPGSAAGGTALAASTTPTLVRAPMASAGAPVARYLRWRLMGTASPWAATLRILAAANSPGL